VPEAVHQLPVAAQHELLVEHALRREKEREGQE
jgi:hypothetical protein